MCVCVCVCTEAGKLVFFGVYESLVLDGQLVQNVEMLSLTMTWKMAVIGHLSTQDKSVQCQEN